MLNRDISKINRLLTRTSTKLPSKGYSFTTTKTFEDKDVAKEIPIGSVLTVCNDEDIIEANKVTPIKKFWIGTSKRKYICIEQCEDRYFISLTTNNSEIDDGCYLINDIIIRTMTKAKTLLFKELGINE